MLLNGQDHVLAAAGYVSTPRSNQWADAALIEANCSDRQVRWYTSNESPNGSHVQFTGIDSGIGFVSQLVDWALLPDQEAL